MREEVPRVTELSRVWALWWDGEGSFHQQIDVTACWRLIVESFGRGESYCTTDDPKIFLQRTSKRTCRSRHIGALYVGRFLPAESSGISDPTYLSTGGFVRKSFSIVIYLSIKDMAVHIPFLTELTRSDISLWLANKLCCLLGSVQSFSLL